jgi:membrane protein implicated in regulation of membrane protease activity
LTPRNKLLLALPLVAVFVFLLAYFQLFTNPEVDVLILALFVAVSLWNRRKFSKQKEGRGSSH